MYEIFVKLLEKNNVKAADVCRATGLPSSLFSEWKKGKSQPKIDKLQKIADYFGVSVEYLRTGVNTIPNVKAVDDHDNIVVLDDETLEIIDALRHNPEMKILFSVSKKATKEDIIKAVKIIEALKEEGE